ncbi:nucleoporin Seh1p [Monosporozyma unispora]|nr:epoxide hydrolase, soluble (sEH) [Kazachstania unispora]
MKPFDSGHEDLVHDVVYDFYGRYVATCSSDQHIKVFKADKETNKWELSDSWKAHDSSVVAIDWASPEFGRIIASVSYDKTLKIWEENPDQEECSGRRWNQLCILNDSQGALYDVKFAPPHLGLKLATIGNDGTLRIYEALEPSDLRAWTLTTEINILKVPPANHLQSDFGLSWCPSRFSAERLAVCVLDQAIIYERVSKSNHTVSGTNNRDLLNQVDNTPFLAHSHSNDNNESAVDDDEYDNDNKNIFNDQDSANGSDMDMDSINSGNANGIINGNSNNNNTNNNINKYRIVAKLNGHRGLIRSISWAPSIGRWYQLIATGSKDGNVRIFKLTDKSISDNVITDDNDTDEDMEKNVSIFNNDPLKLNSKKSQSRLNVELLSEHDDHNGEVWSVSWNLTGTILSSAGDDGKVRLWKSTYSNEFRCMSVITAQQQ